MGERSGALRLFGQMMALPWVTFSWFLGSLTRFVQGMQQAVDGSLEAMPADLTRLRQFDPTTAGAPTADAAANPQKESEMGYRNDCDCGTEECTVRLIEYTIVTIKRGDERILQYNQRLVRTAMTQCEFDAVVIAEYVAHNPVPPGDDIYLRVCSQIKCTWEKQPLYYEERQLDILSQISQKLGPPVLAPVPYRTPD
jgi:hypothetical protein